MLSKKRLKELSKLKNKKSRKEKRSFIVEGTRSIEELLCSDWKVDLLLYCPAFRRDAKAQIILEKVKEKGIPTEEVKQSVLHEVSETVTPAGIVCIVKARTLSLSELLEGKPNTILVLDGIRDPGNLGTLVRTADAVGIDGLVLSKQTAELYSPKVVRSSMGSIFHLPIVEKADLYECAERLKREGFKVVVSAVGTGEPYDKADYSGRVCLIIGSEIEGVGIGLLNLADEVVSIPLYGRAESLNVSVAGGILMYQMQRR